MSPAIVPFSSAQFITYQYAHDRHYLRNCTARSETKRPLCDALQRFTERLSSTVHTYFLIPRDQTSLLELQIAFEGKPERRIDGKVLHLLRTTSLYSSENLK